MDLGSWDLLWRDLKVAIFIQYRKPSSKHLSIIQYIIYTVEIHWRQHICACCNYERGSPTSYMYAYVFAHAGLYRDFVYPSYRMCHRWWNLNCKIHIKLSYDGPSAAPSSFIELRLMHVYISCLTHMCESIEPQTQDQSCPSQEKTYCER